MKYFLEGKQEWMVGKIPKYMTELTRNKGAIIAKTRIRMLNVKGNYKNAHADLKCRICKN